MSNKSTSICDGFADHNGDEFLVEIYSVDEELVDEFCVSRLLEDGKTEPYQPTDAEEEIFHVHAQGIFQGYCDSFNDYCDF